MFDECKKCFAIAVHQKLKDRVHGRVFVKVTYNDELYIRIENDDTEFKTYVSNFAERIFNGWTSDFAVYEVLKQYRAAINERYFK